MYASLARKQLRSQARLAESIPLTRYRMWVYTTFKAKMTAGKNKQTV
jgi:hypothetical protein